MRLLALATAASLQLLNVSSAGLQGDGHSFRADVSGDGRRVAFDSFAGNLTPLSVTLDQEVYVRDRRTGSTRMVSVSRRGRPSNAWSWFPSLSPSGRFVAFCSTASNLARPDRRPRIPHLAPGYDPHLDVFVRDLRRGVTRRASSDRRGRMANGGSCRPSVADTGDVAFESEASDLVAGDRNGVIDTFVHDRSSGRVRAATRPGSEPGPVGSRGAAISREGRYVAFYTPERYDPADADAFGDAYLFDRRTGRREAVSPGTGDCYNQLTLALTPRARHVLHWCNDGLRLYDRGSGEVVPVSPFDAVVSAAGVSADGGTVVFCTGADQLEPPGALGDSVFVWRRGGAGPVSLANAGVCTDSATVSADARTAIFSATMPGLVPADTGDPRQSDVFAAEPLG